MNNTKKNFLSENIGSILAIMWTLFTFWIFKLVLLKEVKAPENITFLVVSGVINIIMIIIGYHYGSSASSKQKQDLINNSINKLQDDTSVTDDKKK